LHVVALANRIAETCQKQNGKWQMAKPIEKQPWQSIPTEQSDNFKTRNSNRKHPEEAQQQAANHHP
jgi:hypothetical protein